MENVESDELIVNNPELEPVLESEIDEMSFEDEEDEEVDSKGLIGFNFKDVKFRTLDEKHKSMSPKLISIYNDVKNHFMSYNGVTSKLSKSYDCIYLGRKIVAKLSITSTKVKVYIAIDPNKYSITQYPHKDLSEKKTHMNTPYFAAVKSPLSIKRIKIVYSDMMNERNVEANNSYEKVDYVQMLKQD